jgi:hypothetical protein
MAPGPSVIDFSQCANGAAPSIAVNCIAEWINGILNPNNSHYSEDQVVPQRFVVGGFDVGSSHTITFKFQARKGSVHAYDSLATWNFTATGADRCQNLLPADCVGGAATTFPIPLDNTPVPPSTLNGDVTSAHQLPGQVFTMYGGSITGVSSYTHDAAPNVGTDDYASITITFTTTQSKVMLLVGGHTSASLGPLGWGEGLGSGSISGGPYHFKWTAVDGASIGNRDNQIQSGALIPPTATPSPTNTPRLTSTFSPTNTTTPS